MKYIETDFSNSNVSYFWFIKNCSEIIEKSKSYLCTSLMAGFLATRNMTRIDFGLARSYVKLLLSYGKHICAIWWHGISTNSRDSYGHKLCFTYSRLILYCYERALCLNFTNLSVIDMFNDTSRYLDDIFTIDNPEFKKYIPDIYPAELHLNKANTSVKETSYI